MQSRPLRSGAPAWQGRSERRVLRTRASEDAARRCASGTERAGFEPARELAPPTRLAGECLQPLGHLSRRASDCRGHRAQVCGPLPGVPAVRMEVPGTPDVPEQPMPEPDAPEIPQTPPKGPEIPEEPPERPEPQIPPGGP